MTRKEELSLIENGAEDWEIEKILNERYKEILDQYVNPAEGMTLNALLDDYWTLHLSQEKNTVLSMSYTTTFWRKQLGKRLIQDIKKGILQ